AGGLETSVSDAGVGARCAPAAGMGANQNVRNKARDQEDRSAVEDYLARGAELQDRAIELERGILDIVHGKLG
ncbi:MAG: glutamate formimidoyltransferase, partial [Planctomycetota bacterium]|nr:glutamate formimidoyltransferase [Planctomycetota bacterium]